MFGHKAIRFNRIDGMVLPPRFSSYFFTRRCFSSNPADDPKKPNEPNVLNRKKKYLETIVEYSKIPEQSHFRDYEKMLEKLKLQYGPTPDAEVVIRQLAICTVDLNYTRDERIAAQKYLDALKGMLGTVGGRGIVDKFFSEHVKPYAVVKDPGTSYTGPEIRSAYENFLKDTKNPVAVALLKYFPNESVRDVAKRYQKLYGKISWYDHTLYEALIKMLTIEQFIDTIQSIPAFLLTKEKYSLEKMIEVFIEFKDDYQT